MFFVDKGSHVLGKVDIPTAIVTERALQRRATVLPADQLLDVSDLPLEERYIRDVEETGARVRHRSRWFNAVSVEATPAQIERLRALPSVREIELVARFTRHPDGEDHRPVERSDGRPSLQKNGSTVSLNYGPAFNQVAAINVPLVHETGNTGQGIIVGVFDNGFRQPDHEAFSSTTILATYDFVEHKVSVVPNDPRSSFGSHGVATLATLGGYAPGQVIGPAFGAHFLLARTENDSSETVVEEDNWVAAIEWAESLGVQVTSTSLGYIDYWSWEDMDGRTTIVSRAATMASRRGIVVVCSAGNEGLNSEHNTLTAPADADSILAVGAVHPDGSRASFSSIGPTTSIPPRIKPDVMAPGTSIYTASGFSRTSYAITQGTSFSCPLAAGVAAMMLRANPQATPMQIITALKKTASRASSPDNLYGWGIIDAKRAVDAILGADTGGTPPLPQGFAVDQNFPNPFNPSTTIRFQLGEQATVTLRVYDALGREVRTLAEGPMPPGVYFRDWDGTDGRGKRVGSGMYVARFDAIGASGSASTVLRKMMLIK